MLDDIQDDAFDWMQGFDQHDGATDQQGQQQADGEHKTVKHGQKHHKPVLTRRLEHKPATFDIGQEVAVREHRPFRMARRARGINNHRQFLFALIRRCPARRFLAGLE